MKLVVFVSMLTFGLLVNAKPATCSKGQDPFAYVVGQVSSVQMIDMDNNQIECSFNVEVHMGNSSVDPNCPIDLYDVELATYVDPSCSVKVGDQFNHSTTQYFSTEDSTSPGLFYWIDLGGYSSQIVFPNYGK